MNLRASFVVTGLVVSVLVSVAACSSGGSGSEDCGAATCGACQDGFVNSDRCEDGEWQCDCVPRTSDGGGAASDAKTSDDGDVGLTCAQILQSPQTGAKCAPGAQSPCEQGCLACTCSGGTWGCTTSASCFDSGGN